MVQLLETSVIHNAPSQKLISDHMLGNILYNDFEKCSVNKMNLKDKNNYNY